MEALLSREQQLEGMEVEEPRAELHIPALARTTSGEGGRRLVEARSCCLS